MIENKKNIIKGIALLVSGILIGTGIGYMKIAPFIKWYTMSSTGNGMASYAEAQFCNASYPHALKAQNEYLSYLAAVEKKKPEWGSWAVPWMSEDIMNYERTMTYARIAILEEKMGNAADAEKNWTIAEKTAMLAGWKNSTRRYIVKIVSGMSRFHKSGDIVQPVR